jgi:RND family efflux transporter MFP subunit
MKRRRLFIVGAAIVFLGLSGVVFAFWGGGTQYETYTVNRVDIERTVDASAELISLERVDLSFNTSGILDEYFIGLGEAVERGDVIAELSNGEIQADVDRALGQVNIARASLTQAAAGSTLESVALAEAELASARVRLDSAEADLVTSDARSANSVEEIRTRLVSARSDVDDLADTQGQDVLALNDDVVNVARSVATEVRSAISESDKVLGEENSTLIAGFEDIISTADINARNAAKRAFVQAANSRDALEEVVYIYSRTDSDEEISQLLTLTENALQNTQALLLEVRKMLDATIVETANFTIADLATLKASIDAARNSLSLEEDVFGSTLLAYNRLETSQRIELRVARDAVAVLEAQLNSALADRASTLSAIRSRIREAESDIVRAEARLNEVKAGPRMVDLAPLQREVDRALADLRSSEARLEKTQIISPISGTMTQLLVDAGEQVAIGQTVAVVQTTEDAYLVRALIPESDIDDIREDQEALIEFDAFGSDVALAGVIETVRPGERIIEGVVFYEVDVSLPEDFDLSLRPGLSAEVVVETGEREDVLAIPRRYIMTENGYSFVEIMRDGKPQKRILTLGLRADGGLVEVLEGLAEGDEVIIGEL